MDSLVGEYKMTANEILQLIQSLIWLLAGVGVFIVGMGFLSDSLEKSAGGGMKKLLGKISGNRFSGVGIGAGVTAIIQSSSATSVMVIGLVNAGVLTLLQATPIIMGANIGTTITAQLAALSSFDIAPAFILLLFIGVMMEMLSKNDKVKSVGLALAGLGLVFFGLEIMSSSMSGYKNEPVVIELLGSIHNPFLVLLFGIIFTALLQLFSG